LLSAWKSRGACSQTFLMGFGPSSSRRCLIPSLSPSPLLLRPPPEPQAPPAKRASAGGIAAPRPGPTSVLIASTLQSSMTGRGVMPAHRNQVSVMVRGPLRNNGSRRSAFKATFKADHVPAGHLQTRDLRAAGRRWSSTPSTIRSVCTSAIGCRSPASPKAIPLRGRHRSEPAGCGTAGMVGQR
jgi:hypothetical protein